MKRSKCAVFVVLAGVFLCAGARSACAETTWYVDDDGPADFSTIQAALDAAYHGDTIIVRDGTYTGVGNRDIDFKGKAVHLKSENGPESCVIDAQGRESSHHRVFWLSSAREESIVDGFTITGGYAAEAGVSNPVGAGGGIYCFYSSPTIINNIISQNHSRGGGGIYCYGSSPTIANNIIVDNTADNGAGLYAAWSGSSPTVVNNVITGNTAEFTGGGIYVSDGSAIITGNVIADNNARQGAGVGGSDTSPTIEGNHITGNTATDYGGGLGFHGRSSPRIINNVIANNTAGEHAGAIWLQISSATIIGNTITANTAGDHAGAIWLHTSSATITSNTITANTAGREGGGGLYGWESSITITDTILWGNSTTGVGQQMALFWGASSSVSYSNVQGGEAAVYTMGGGVLAWGAGNLDADPLFADSANGDYHLKSEYGRWDADANNGVGGWVHDDVTSGGIDAGDPASGFADEPGPNGGRVNMGAYGNTAEASKSTWSVTVESAPFGGVSVGGDRPGETPYSLTCTNQEAVRLVAPESVTVDGVRYNLVRWMVDALEQPAGQTELDLTVDRALTVVAAYELRQHTLEVGSEPVGGFQIDGDKPGQTDYAATCDDQQVVTLTAPPSGRIDGNQYVFVRWVIDGEDQTEGEATVQVTMDGAHGATAVYEPAPRLRVLTAPILAVEIAGLRPGTSDYTVDCDQGEMVYLTAPRSVVANDRVLRLHCWFVDGEPRLKGQADILVVMDADHVALAQYEWRLQGDMNDDCVVNVLDLIHVRNRLGTRCSE